MVADAPASKALESGSALTGNLGVRFRNGDPVTATLLERLPATVSEGGAVAIAGLRLPALTPGLAAGARMIADIRPRAIRLLDAARAPLDRVRRLALPEAGRPEQTLSEHRALVDAIRTRDGEFAAAAMRAHLAQVGRTIEYVNEI